MTCAFTVMPSPVGDLKLVAGDAGLVAVLWPSDTAKRVRLGPLTHSPQHPLLIQADRELREYFAGRRTAFTIPLDLVGTPFQRQMWQALQAIPFGETRSYADLARQIGKPAACRAVGAANGRNPLSIIVPCHRAIGSNGALTGFAGGLDAKRYLLDHERKQIRRAA